MEDRSGEALLDLGQVGQLVEDLGVIEHAAKLLRTHAVGVDVHHGTGVSVGGVVHAGFMVDGMADGHAEGDVGAVQLVVLLGHVLLAGRADLQGALVGGAQVLHLVVGQQQLAGAGGIRVGGQGQTEVCLHILHGSFKGGLVGDVVLHIGRIKLCVRHLLMGQIGQEGVVVGGLVADGHTAGLVVSGDKDQGLVGVLVLELHSCLHGVAQLQHIVDGSSGIVGVAGPVDLAGLGHQEETLGVIQQLDALLDVIGQLPLACSGVHGVVHGLAVCQILGNDQGLACACGQGGSACLRGDHIVACLSSHLVVVGAGAVAVHLLELAAGKVFKAGVCQLHADLVVVLAGLLMSVEGGGSGVVDVDRGDDAHLVALLGVQLFGNGLIGHIAGPGAHVDDAALGLVAGSNGGCGGSGVRAEGGAVVGGHAAHGGKAGEAQVGLGHSAVVVHGALVEAGRLDLGGAHAVTDEQEDVLGFLEQVQQAVLLILGSSGVRLGCTCSHGCCGHHAGSGSGCTKLQKTAAGDLIFFHNVILSFYPIKCGGPASGTVFCLSGTSIL